MTSDYRRGIPMKATLRAGRLGVGFRLLVIGIALAIGWVWLGSGSVDCVMAQSGVPDATAGGQTQARAPPAAPAAAGAQSREDAHYLVGRWGSFAIAIGFLLVVLLLTVLVKSEAGINFFQSPDGAVSVARVQVWMWTMAIIFAYVYLFLWHGPPEKFPDSSWELMGISALSTGVARYIAVVTGKTQTPAPEIQQKIKKQNWLVSMLSDDGEPSMMRLQMFGWTLVTVFLFLMYLHKEQKLWDVPQTLVILMGISHAGYLGDKGAAAAKPN
jgi:hypothetical protein